MRDYMPLLGTDYLVDWYTILGIPRTASCEDAHAAYRKKAAGLHPDKVASLDPQLNTQATRAFKLIGQAYGILSDPKKKSAFDKQLATFDPECISEDGTPILKLSKVGINLDHLLSQESIDPQQEMIQAASRLTGFNQHVFDAIEAQYKGAEDPPDELRKAYAVQLAVKDAFFMALEDAHWKGVGVFTTDDPYFTSGTQYLAARAGEAEKYETSIAGGVNARVLALEQGNIPKLLGPSGEITQDEGGLEQELSDHAFSRFREGKQRAMGLAEQRAEVIDEMAKVVHVEYVRNQQGDDLLAALVIDGKVTTGFKVRKEGNGASVIDQERYDCAVQDFPCAEFMGSILLIHHTNDFPLSLELGAAIERHFNAD